MIIIHRKEASDKCLKRYYTGKECVNGHVAERQVTNGACTVCAKIRTDDYTSKNRDKIKARKRKNSVNIKKQSKEYYIKNAESRKAYLADNADAIALSCKIYSSANADSIKEYKKRWYVENKEKHAEYARNRYARVKDDPSFKLSKTLRQMLRRVLLLTGDEKTDKSEVMVGYTKLELMCHLEKMFTDGMTWMNYGEWHIDHIVPVSWWLKNDVTDPSMINALINLQPLWAQDNMAKGDKC